MGEMKIVRIVRIVRAQKFAFGFGLWARNKKMKKQKSSKILFSQANF